MVVAVHRRSQQTAGQRRGLSTCSSTARATHGELGDQARARLIHDLVEPLLGSLTGKGSTTRQLEIVVINILRRESLLLAGGIKKV